ncbi:MAG: hypothetical protein DRI57_27735 [Deltaproteobacteria bacterium]|nr:MAG: hypothetical protein DRI57_27735 [Deltaproteobacteria bacterium]
METAISLPNRLFYIAEEYAEKHGLSRSELYAVAVSEFIEKREKKELIDITRKINEICDTADIPLNPQISAASRRILRDSEW